MTMLLRNLKRTDGAEIAEAALVMPVVFLFLLGIVWFGRAFNIYSTITQAAQQGAVVAARASCATCGNAFPVDATVTNAVFGVMRASSLDPAQIPVSSDPPTPVSCLDPPVDPCVTSSNVVICRQVQLNAPAASGDPSICGTLVSFQFPFQFYLPFTSLNLTRITMSAQAQSRMEN